MRRGVAAVLVGDVAFPVARVPRKLHGESPRERAHALGTQGGWERVGEGGGQGVEGGVGGIEKGGGQPHPGVPTGLLCGV